MKFLKILRASWVNNRVSRSGLVISGVTLFVYLIVGLWLVTQRQRPGWIILIPFGPSIALFIRSLSPPIGFFRGLAVFLGGNLLINGPLMAFFELDAAALPGIVVYVVSGIFLLRYGFSQSTMIDKTDAPLGKEIVTNPKSEMNDAGAKDPVVTKIKTVYSFVAATIKLDLNTQMGKAMVQQIFPYACQNLRQGNPEFNRLYSKVERENIHHVQGTGMAASNEGFADAFSDWLKSRSIHIKNADRKRKISVFGGDAQNPQTGLSFNWGVLIYFDIEESTFSMKIEDKFFIKNRGPVVTGKVQSGVLQVGDKVEIITLHGRQKAIVDGIEKFRKQTDIITVGESAGIMLKSEQLTKDFLKNHVKIGDLLCSSTDKTDSPLGKEIDANLKSEMNDAASEEPIESELNVKTSSPRAKMSKTDSDYACQFCGKQLREKPEILAIKTSGGLVGSILKDMQAEEQLTLKRSCDSCGSIFCLECSTAQATKRKSSGAQCPKCGTKMLVTP